MSDTNPADLQNATTCESCGTKDNNLLTVDSGLKLTLTNSGAEKIPNHVCASCLKKLKKSATVGTQLKAKEEARILHRQDLWRVRLDVVRQGRACFQNRDYAGAALLYEKYLKIVSLALDKEKNSMTAKDFSDNTKEITIIVSTLWDLMLIYDSHPKFAPQQKETAEVLSRFLRFSPLYNTLIRKAEVQVGQAKNSANFRYLLKLCDASASRCFIANAAFETRTDPAVQQLCQWRDLHLRHSWLGRRFITFYYRHSPHWALWLQRHPRLKPAARSILRVVASSFQLTFNLPPRRDSSSL